MSTGSMATRTDASARIRAMLNHHKNPHHTFMYIWIGGAFLVLIIGMISYAIAHPRVAHAPEPLPDEKGSGIATTTNALPTSTTVEVGLNQEATVGGRSVTVVRVLEDSRCPTDVQCIQAGTVRIAVSLDDASTEQVLALGKQAPLADGLLVTLTTVSPTKISTATIANSDYRFTLLLEGAR